MANLKSLGPLLFKLRPEATQHWHPLGSKRLGSAESQAP